MLARHERIDDQSLRDALADVIEGRAVVNLGGNVYKVRMAREDAGKRGGYRVPLCLRLGDRAFFLSSDFSAQPQRIFVTRFDTGDEQQEHEKCGLPPYRDTNPKGN